MSELRERRPDDATSPSLPKAAPYTPTKTFSEVFQKWGHINVNALLIVAFLVYAPEFWSRHARPLLYPDKPPHVLVAELRAAFDAIVSDLLSGDLKAYETPLPEDIFTTDTTTKRAFRRLYSLRDKIQEQHRRAENIRAPVGWDYRANREKPRPDKKPRAPEQAAALIREIYARHAAAHPNDGRTRDYRFVAELASMPDPPKPPSQFTGYIVEREIPAALKLDMPNVSIADLERAESSYHSLMEAGRTFSVNLLSAFESAIAMGPQANTPAGSTNPLYREEVYVPLQRALDALRFIDRKSMVERQKSGHRGSIDHWLPPLSALDLTNANLVEAKRLQDHRAIARAIAAFGDRMPFAEHLSKEIRSLFRDIDSSFCYWCLRFL